MQLQADGLRRRGWLAVGVVSVGSEAKAHDAFVRLLRGGVELRQPRQAAGHERQNTRGERIQSPQVPDGPLAQDSPDAVDHVVGGEARGFIDNEYAIHEGIWYFSCVSLSLKIKCLAERSRITQLLNYHLPHDSPSRRPAAVLDSVHQQLSDWAESADLFLRVVARSPQSQSLGRPARHRSGAFDGFLVGIAKLLSASQRASLLHVHVPAWLMDARDRQHVVLIHFWR